ncbi:MAG: 4Fe-4S dicluster domain-containing protein [Candidatus Magnetomorum sp.]|nr:4Fe-4S dicluster domain-containing protein [Candidatus Magnetomorum sp.]
MLKYSFYVSFVIFIFGLIYRMVQWVRFDLDTISAEQSKTRRFIALWESLWNHLISAQALMMLKAFVWDGLFQASIAKSSMMRWIAHMSIFWGFILLLLFHALDDYVSVKLFSDYASTLNPFLFLRNLMGMLVLFGIFVAFYRRRRQFIIKRVSRRMDFAVLWLIAGIIISGFLLEAVQIISENQFDLMVSDYMITDDEAEISALRAYWAKHYSVSFSQPVHITDAEVLELGKSIHQDSCMSCHSQPQSAFVSHNLSQCLRPVAGILNAVNADAILLIVHYMLCFLGLAWLPFGKMFHMISTPINFCVNASTQPSKNPTAAANRNIIALDACTHCGTCSQSCSVEPINRIIGNPCILPSEKIQAVRLMASGAHPVSLENLLQGNAVCTSCNQCSLNCPSGIPLLEIWQITKKELHCKGLYRPEQMIHQHTAYEWSAIWKAQEKSASDVQPVKSIQSFISDDPSTYEACVQCSVCTQVCPVVAATSTSGDPIDLTPQQVMNLLRIGLKDNALGTQMVWMCATCYMCQEHCPQHIPIADIFYELRNLAHQQFIHQKTGDK